MTRAVVFAYHNVGVRCLRVLLDRGIEVPLVLTHEDAPGETIWYDSVASVCREHGIPHLTVDDPNDAATVRRIRALAPDFLFSFYYRKMLGAELLSIAPRGALNMHGSMLPKYRGRVPVNWAVLKGERQTGATLHVMNEKPDNGAIVEQFAVPILPDDTAREVFDKVCVAAELVLWRCLPALIDGSARPVPQDLSRGRYFGGRRPEDGRIPARIGARRLHDFVRALARPYPGAFADLEAGRLVLWRTLPDGTVARRPGAAELRVIDDALAIVCADGGKLRVLDATLDGTPLDARSFRAAFGSASIPLGR